MNNQSSVHLSYFQAERDATKLAEYLRQIFPYQITPHVWDNWSIATDTLSFVRLVWKIRVHSVNEIGRFTIIKGIHIYDNIDITMILLTRCKNEN